MPGTTLESSTRAVSTLNHWVSHLSISTIALLIFYFLMVLETEPGASHLLVSTLPRNGPSHAKSAIYFSFGDSVPLNCPGCPWTCNVPTSASRFAGIPDPAPQGSAYNHLLNGRTWMALGKEKSSNFSVILADTDISITSPRVRVMCYRIKQMSNCGIFSYYFLLCIQTLGFLV